MDQYIKAKDYYSGKTHIIIYSPVISKEENERRWKESGQRIADLMD